jgi:hypothetical protein
MSEVRPTAIQIKPVHVQGFENISGLVVFPPHQGFSTDNIDVAVELCCGEGSISVAGAIYNVRIRCCHLDLVLENATLRRDSAYECVLQRPDVKVEHEHHREQGHLLSGAIGVSASIKTWVPTLRAVIEGKAAAHRSGRSTEKEHTEPIVQLISKTGTQRWDIGHPVYGDKRQHDGLLYGRYFTECRNADGDTPPLARIQMESSLTSAAAYVFILLKSGQLSVTPTKQKWWDEFSSKANKDIERRARIAGMALIKAIRERQKIQSETGEVVVAAAGFKIEK